MYDQEHLDELLQHYIDIYRIHGEDVDKRTILTDKFIDDPTTHTTQCLRSKTKVAVEVVLREKIKELEEYIEKNSTAYLGRYYSSDVLDHMRETAKEYEKEKDFLVDILEDIRHLMVC